MYFCYLGFLMITHDGFPAYSTLSPILPGGQILAFSLTEAFSVFRVLRETTKGKERNKWLIR